MRYNSIVITICEGRIISQKGNVHELCEDYLGKRIKFLES